MTITPDEKTTLVGVAGGIASVIVALTGKVIDPNLIYWFLLGSIIILSFALAVLGKLSPGIEKKVVKDVTDIGQNTVQNIETILGGSTLKQLDSLLVSLTQAKDNLNSKTDQIQKLLSEFNELKKKSEELTNQVKEIVSQEQK